MSIRFFNITVSVLVAMANGISSCQESGSQMQAANPEWLPNSYAQGFRLGMENQDSFLLLMDPITHDTLGQFQWGPHTYSNFRHIENRTRIASGSGVISALLCALNIQDRVVAVDQLSYQPHLLQTQEDLVEFSSGGTMNRDCLVQTQPDLILNYFFEASSREDLDRLQSHIPVFWIQNYREQHPLAKAEWIRAIGYLFGHYAQAELLFSRIAKHYQELSQRDLVSRPVFCNLPYSGTWSFPGGNSYLNALIKDAGGVPVWPQSQSSESISLGIEESAALLKSQPNILWLHPGDCPDWNCVLERAPRIMQNMKLQPSQIAQCDKGDLAGHVNRWYNEGSVRPDLLLSDLQHLTQDSVIQPDDLYFYRCFIPAP